MTSSEQAPPAVTRRFRITALDIVIIAALAAFAAYTVYRINTQLVYNWDWGSLLNFFAYFDEKTQGWRPNLLTKGLLITIQVAVWGGILGLSIGLTMGLCRVSKVAGLRMLSRGYVELVRNMAPVPFLFIMFFFVGNQLLKPLELGEFFSHAPPLVQAVMNFLFGDTNLLRNFIAAMIALALYEGAYITEIVRAGIQSIEKGQWEAGQSIGLTRLQLLRYIILPQAIQKVAPPLANQSIQLIKDSSLVSLLSIQELTFMGQEIAHSTTRFFETWIIIAAMYFCLCWGLSRLYKRLERTSADGNS